jgi:hypothetical protein
MSYEDATEDRIKELVHENVRLRDEAIKAWGARDQYMESNVKLVAAERQLRADNKRLSRDKAELVTCLRELAIMVHSIPFGGTYENARNMLAKHDPH